MTSSNSSKIGDWSIETMLNMLNADLDDDMMACYNLPDIVEIVNDYHLIIGARLKGLDKVIDNGEVANKHLIVMNGVYFTVEIDVIYSSDREDCAADFKFKKFNLISDATFDFYSV
jgi:hypothetical protein